MEYVSHNQEMKDKREWAILQLFRSSYTSFPIGEVTKSECPDFLIETHKGLIGLELTELMYDRNDQKFNLRAHESWLESIMYDAQTEFEAHNDLKLIVDVHFSNELGPSVARPKEDPSILIHDGFKEAILKMVNENIPEATGQRYIIDRNSKYGYLNLPSKIEAIYIKNVTGRFDDGLWYAGISTMVKPMSVQSVAERIASKNAKLSHYNHDCVKNWLMIIQNSFLMSSQYDQKLVERALTHQYVSLFDKVFVFERSEGQVTELRLKRPNTITPKK